MRPAILLVLALLLSPVIARAGDDDPDPTFSGDGIATVGWSGESAYARAFLPLASGELLVGGFAGVPGALGGGAFDFLVLRYTAAGALDGSWGSGGIRRVSFNRTAANDDRLMALRNTFFGTLLAGSVLVAGDDVRPAAARLDASGTLDGAFGSFGKVVIETLPWAGAKVLTLDAAIRTGGKMVFVGQCRDCTGVGATDPFVLQLEADGDPDLTFGSGGWVLLDDGGELGFAGQVAIAEDGSIYVAGGIGRSNLHALAFVTRLTTAGAPDPTFAGGTVTLDLGSNWNVRDVAVDENRGAPIVAFDAFTYDGKLLRLTAAGAPDPAFGSGGFLDLDLGEQILLGGVAVRSDGKLMVAGGIDVSTADNGDFLVARVLPNGTLDPSFDGNGLRRIAIDVDAGRPDDFALAVGLDSAGRTLLAGYADDANGYFAGVVRLQTSLAFADGFERGTTDGWDIDIP
jgi:uncharacterized delta-60 repeat protein